jgi:DNA-directed RNA polymerase subunit RPC12/RpoP
MKLTHHLIAVGIAIAAFILIIPYASEYQESGFGHRSWTNYTVQIALVFYYPFEPVNQTEIYMIHPGVMQTEAYTYRYAWEFIIPGLLIVYGISLSQVSRESRRKKKSTQVICKYCNTELLLAIDEIKQGWYVCAKCNKKVDILSEGKVDQVVTN